MGFSKIEKKIEIGTQFKRYRLQLQERLNCIGIGDNVLKWGLY